MAQCTRCNSHAINEHQHGREKGVDMDLCDVCYWRKRADDYADEYRAIVNVFLDCFNADS